MSRNELMLRTRWTETSGEPARADARERLAALSEGVWESLRDVPLDPKRLAKNRLITAARSDPAAAAFDVLRTRLLRTLRDRGWHRVAITSPTQACGKSFVAANLAMALARVPRSRTLLLEMDLRVPTLAKLFGIAEPGRLRALLEGRIAIEEHLVRANPGLALGLNAVAEADAAELLQDPETAANLAAIRAALRADVVLYDLPPVLACDDVLAFLPQVDGVLLVACGGLTRGEDVRTCERLFAGQAPLIGVILNKSEDPPLDAYGYGVPPG